MSIFGKAILGVAGAATFLTSALPLSAADMGADVTVSGQKATMMEQTAEGHRRRWRRHNDIDGGDIVAGIGILAGIAIIADVASKADNGPRRRRNDSPEYRPDYRPDYDSRSPDRYDDRSAGASGNDLGSAVTACTDAAERSAGGNSRVREIGSVTRDGSGWRVDGSLDGRDNESFTCTATGGRVDQIRINNRI